MGGERWCSQRHAPVPPLNQPSRQSLSSVMSVCAGTQTGAERVVGGKGWGKAHQRPPPPVLGRVFCRRGVWSPHASQTDAGGSGGGGEGLGWWDGDQWLLTMPSPLSGGYKSCSVERAVRGVPISIPSHHTHRTCIYPPTRSFPPLASALPRAPRQPLPPPTRPPRSTTTTPNTLPTRPSTFVMAPSRAPSRPWPRRRWP